ncbi:hypothetical protein NMY22_g15110 [Coprinellus aureogranulatus]|nr:hypothetical protein NMY22_g15110 [Coprinellus aureogranulatus]
MQPSTSSSSTGSKRARETTSAPTEPSQRKKKKKKRSPYLETLSVRDQPIDRVHWIETAALFGTPEQLAASLTNQVGAEVLYEVQEDCFRLDLLALDQHLAAAKWPTTSSPQAETLRMKRRNLVREVFPSKPGPGLVLDGFLITSIPNVDRGLASYDYYGRHISILALRKLMLDWPDCPLEIKQASGGFHPRPAGELECLVVAHFCQTFFNTFGRIPIPPPHLPHISTTRSAPKSLASLSLTAS